MLNLRAPSLGQSLWTLVFTAWLGWLLSASLLAAPPQETYEQLVRRGPNTIDWLLKVGNDQENMIAWRKYAESLLEKDPSSPLGNAVLGEVFYRAEGDLPRARHLFERASRFAMARGRNDNRSLLLYVSIQMEFSQLLGEMDAYEDKIELVDRLSKLPGFDFFQIDKAWPLMKLDREEEARQVIARAFASNNPSARAMAWNSLGALEAEMGNYQAAYNAFESLIREDEERKGSSDPTIYRNLGETALNLGRYDEAERWFIKASQAPFNDQVYTNPYCDLTNLYISEAKFAEAVSSLQKAFEWSRALRPFLYQQFTAENLQTTGELLMEMGYIPEAVRKLERLVNRPDRQGGSSVDVDQAEAGNLLTWYTALKAQREWLREHSSWSKGWAWWRLKWELVQTQFQLWQSASRLRALMTENHRIAASFRPYSAQGITASENYRPLLIPILGTGTCAAALESLTRVPYANFPVEEPFLLVNKAEISYQNGDYKVALQNYLKAIEILPKAAALERSVAQARAAQLHDYYGELPQACRLFAQLLRSTPTALRHMEVEIPIVCQSDNSPASSKVIDMLDDSPRFKVERQGLPVRIYLRGNTYCADVMDLQGGIISTSQVKLGQDNFESASRLAAEIHNQTLATKIDLGSLSLDSLDGATTSGSTARRSFGDLFEEEQNRISG